MRRANLENFGDAMTFDHVVFHNEESNGQDKDGSYEAALMRLDLKTV